MTRPFNRVIDAVVAIAEKMGATVSATGNRLADGLEAIADKGVLGTGGVGNVEASTASTVAGVVSDLNGLITALKDGGVIEPDKFTLSFASVVDSVAGHADRQFNTSKISNVSVAGDVISITLSCKVSELKDFDGKNGWGVHKWLGIGVGAGISPITGLLYNGSELTASDVEEATTCGLSAGYFVRWVAADLVLAGDNSQKSKGFFTLSAPGYEATEYKLKIVEGGGGK